MRRSSVVPHEALAPRATGTPSRLVVGLRLGACACGSCPSGCLRPPAFKSSSGSCHVRVRASRTVRPGEQPARGLVSSRLPERPRPSALVPAVVTACQLGAWWSACTLDSVTRILMDRSALLVENFSVHTCMSSSKHTRPRPRAPLTTLCREPLWKVLLCVRLVVSRLAESS